MTSQTIKKSPVLSHAFVTFVSYLPEGERERLTERRLSSILESRNESVQDYLRNRSTAL